MIALAEVTSVSQSEYEAANERPALEHPPTPIVFSLAQRKALASLCRLHEQGIHPRWFSRRSLALALYIGCVLTISVQILHMTVLAAPGYLFLGFVLGALLKDLRVLMQFRAVWPVYDAVIDWARRSNC
jgi:hypothetical protein